MIHNDTRSKDAGTSQRANACAREQMIGYGANSATEFRTIVRIISSPMGGAAWLNS